MTNYRIIERDRTDALGEGLFWSVREQALYWTDIIGHRINRLTHETVETWTLSEPVGWVIERRDHPGLIAGLKSGFHHLALSPLGLDPIGDPEPERPDNRLNDAKADARGRIWAGSKDDRDIDASGALYRLDADHTWTRMDDGYGVTNGPAFALDGRTMFHTDSAARTVYRFDLTDDGSIANKRAFIVFEQDWGYPDGMTVDAEGGLWIAHWGGGRVSRFDEQGRMERSIVLPASQTTNCCFAGQHLDRMFVTSAATGVNEAQGGALFEIDPGVRGLPPHLYAG